MFPEFLIITNDILTTEQLELLCHRFGKNFYLQWRAKHLSVDIFLEHSKHYLTHCHSYGVKLLINHPQAFLVKNTLGYHLTSDALNQCKSRPVGNKKVLSAACHHQTDVCQAKRLGVDIVILSPVLSTKTHPDQPCLGWSGAKNIIQSCLLPIYCLGGMKPGDLKKAQSIGAKGVAGIRHFLTAPISRSSPTFSSK